MNPSTKWLEQCRATATIRERFGLSSAFDYLVAEKLLDFARTAEREPDFARQLPGFVSEVRRIFAWQEIRDQLARIEREQEALELAPLDEEGDEEDEILFDAPETIAAVARSFRMMKHLLLAPELGTS